MENLIDCCIDCPNADKSEDDCYNDEPCYECPKQKRYWQEHKSLTFRGFGSSLYKTKDIGG